MRLVHRDTARRGGPSAHRPGGVSFTYLLEGDAFDPGNFALMLVHVVDRYEAPPHRHNFDQVRVMLDGRFGFGPGREQGPGSIGYFCEGTSYTQSAIGASTTLLLQLGGASGSGYMSEPQMRAGVEATSQRGSFHDGVYAWVDERGHARRLDGYEAVWQQVFGRPVAYPQPRFDGPVLFEPARFAWIDDDDRPGVATRRFATFHERDLRLLAKRVAPGTATTLEVPGRRWLAYVMSGDGRVDGQAPLTAGSAVDVAGDERLSLVAGDAGLECLVFVLPAFGSAAGRSTL